MKIFYACIRILTLASFLSGAFAYPRSGFFLPDSLDEMTISYKTLENLIILPVVLNDSVKVNLILDTGCRNLVLFGRRFRKLVRPDSSKPIQFSGLGSGEPVLGYVSLHNKVSIREVLGERIPVVVVPGRNVFVSYSDVHGVIGYDIFMKFEIELNPSLRQITFRPAMRAVPRKGYTQVPLMIADCRPVMRAVIDSDADTGERPYDLMIDTGSSLGLLLKTTRQDGFRRKNRLTVLGQGFNGGISGRELIADQLRIDTSLVMRSLPAAIINSPWHNCASIGMAILKDYVVVLNYCKAYACFRKADA